MIAMLVFFADWCPKCHMMLPIVEELEKEFQNTYEVTYISIDENVQLAENYGVEIVPTFVFQNQGKEMRRMSGVIGEETLRKRMREIIKNACNFETSII